MNFIIIYVCQIITIQHWKIDLKFEHRSIKSFYQKEPVVKYYNTQKLWMKKLRVPRISRATSSK